jgi:hypothetical protein
LLSKYIKIHIYRISLSYNVPKLTYHTFLPKEILRILLLNKVN